MANNICNPECGNWTYSGCILYTGQTLESDSCDIKICNGTSLDDILETIYNSICEQNSVCKVKIDENDTCGYLEDKFSSNDGSVEIEQVDGKLDLSVGGLTILKYSEYVNTTDNNDTLKTYTLEQGSLETDGDILEVEGYFSSSDSAELVQISFYFDTSPITTQLSGTNINALFNLKVTRLSATTVRILAKVKQITSSNIVANEFVTVSGTLTVSNLDSNDIEVKFTEDLGNANVTQKTFDVKLYKQ